jgi:hypothetical protein
MWGGASCRALMVELFSLLLQTLIHG